MTALSRPRGGRDRDPIRVLVVDDSAVVRQVMTAVLGQARGLRVTVAADPIIAMEKMKRERPDVIVLDLEMPRMDGLSFLRKIMAEDPIPVVVCSGLAGPGTEASLRALEEGALEIVTKPKLGVKGFLEESTVMLVDAVRAAAHARLRARPLPYPRASSRLAQPPGGPAPERLGLRLTTDKVVAIGASTGGTEALRQLLEAMPPSAPGIVIVQHMPEVFTRAFADRLDQTCRIDVKEAQSGDRVREGCALIAPGNRHTRLVRSGALYAVEVTDGPLVSRHRPSVDVLFRSVALAAGPNAVGVIMTGMGDDGAAGLLEMKHAGGATLAQDEATCVVFGMPKEAIQMGAVDEVLPLPKIPTAILERAARGTSFRRPGVHRRPLKDI
jgi:two-component system chemotaxis response regulator CheB